MLEIVAHYILFIYDVDMHISLVMDQCKYASTVLSVLLHSLHTSNIHPPTCPWDRLSTLPPLALITVGIFAIPTEYGQLICIDFPIRGSRSGWVNWVAVTVTVRAIGTGNKQDCTGIECLWHLSLESRIGWLQYRDTHSHALVVVTHKRRCERSSTVDCDTGNFAACSRTVPIETLIERRALLSNNSRNSCSIFGSSHTQQASWWCGRLRFGGW